MQGDDICALQNGIGRISQFDLEFIGPGLGQKGIEGHNLHVEPLRPLDELAPDPAHADYGEPFAIEFDAGVLKREYERVDANEDAALLTSLAKVGVCTMLAAAAQKTQKLKYRTEYHLRYPPFPKYLTKLENSCLSYMVQMPTASEEFREHTALYDAEVAGRLYFAMRGVRYTEGLRAELR